MYIPFIVGLLFSFALSTLPTQQVAAVLPTPAPIVETIVQATAPSSAPTATPVATVTRKPVIASAKSQLTIQPPVTDPSPQISPVATVLPTPPATPAPAASATPGSSCPANVPQTNWLWLPPECRPPSDRDIETLPQQLTSGISGTITVGPSCPVVTMTANGVISNCADKPYATEMIVTRGQSNEEVTRFTSNADGTYFLNLQPGTYTISSADPGLKSMTHVEPKTITVTYGQVKQVNFAFDNGMR